MPSLGTLLALAAVVGVVLVVLSRASEIFCVSVRDGRCLIVRGNVPPAVWRELREVVSRARIHRGTIRAVKHDGGVRLACRGVDAGTQQRLRNALGSTGFGHLKASAQTGNASSGRSRNLGQLLGIAWLAWFLSGR